MAKKVSASSRMERVEHSFDPDKDLLHTGSTMLNLMLSGRPDGGYVRGRYFYFVGDSSSGKTWFTLAALAEAANNPAFDDYRLIYDDVEGGALMDKERYFGNKLAQRIEAPSGTRDNPEHSDTVESFYFNLDDAFKRREPFIYVLDSQDSLGSLYGDKKFAEMKKAVRADTKAKGDYGDGKAKFHSGRIRRVVTKLRETGSILIVINQTRDVLDAQPFTPSKQTSGGRALKFYASAQLWTSVKGKLYRTLRGKKRQIGIEVLVSIKKNRLTGREWQTVIPLYHSHGIDDIGACVSFLAEEGVWERNKQGRISCEDFDSIGGTLDDVVQQIEQQGLEEEVHEIAQDTFEDIIVATQVKRKSRYE